MVAHTNDMAGVGNAAVQHLLIQHATMLPRSDLQEWRRWHVPRMRSRMSFDERCVTAPWLTRLAALTEPGGTVLTGDREDIEALASVLRGVGVELI